MGGSKLDNHHVYNQHHNYYLNKGRQPTPFPYLNREMVTLELMRAKRQLQLTFEEIAQQVGGSKEWIAAVMLGQQSMKFEDAFRLTQVLLVDSRIAYILEEAPMRGSLDRTVPVDPLIYRFYEITQVYGTTLKALINEMFGDGIMSAIDLDISVDKRPDDEDPKAERVVITLDGKFLPYKKW